MDTTIITTNTPPIGKEIDPNLYALKERVGNSVVRVFDESLRFEGETHASEVTIIIAVLDDQ